MLVLNKHAAHSVDGPHIATCTIEVYNIHATIFKIAGAPSRSHFLYRIFVPHILLSCETRLKCLRDTIMKCCVTNEHFRNTTPLSRDSTIQTCVRHTGDSSVSRASLSSCIWMVLYMHQAAQNVCMAVCTTH